MKGRFRLIALALLSAAAALGAAALLINIMERKQEAKNPFYRVVELDDDTTDPEVWGKNFPFQYDGYKRTVDMERTRFGGSEAVPRKVTPDDPRTVTAPSKLDEFPQLRTLWAGYAFSVDYRKKRGHAYMLEDQLFTQRQKYKPQPGTCLHCHASVYAPYKHAGGGDLIKGFEKLNPLPYSQARKSVTHPVSCIDCHDPKTMQLRVTRPAFLEGLRALKASQGVQNYDVNLMATRQEMRTYACAQCHVEYYFKGKTKRLTYPWAKGVKVDQILAYYEEEGFTDWVHELTGAPVLKAQHPEFETWSQGIHARSGVSCADCHMPYTRVGALKISDHHVRSPLLNINRACQTCHKWPEAELKARVETIQGRTDHMMRLALDALVDLIRDLQAARRMGVKEPDLADAYRWQRKAQFFVDFVNAENSTGFHAPQESLRILGESIDASRKGQMSLRQLRASSGESGVF